jgi:hypothetical protein
MAQGLKAEVCAIWEPFGVAAIKAEQKLDFVKTLEDNKFYCRGNGEPLIDSLKRMKYHICPLIRSGAPNRKMSKKK